MKKALQTIGVVAAIIGSLFVLVTYFASLSYVKESDAEILSAMEEKDTEILYRVAMMDIRLRLQLNKEAIVQTNQMLWQLYNKYGNQDVDTWYNETDKNLCRTLRLQLDELMRVRGELLKKGSK